MTSKVLIVEDEIIVAMEIEQTIMDMGLDPVGIATDQASALRLASETDVALVDLNLRDGPTGSTIGRILAQTHGATVIFLTANPAQLGDGVEGTVGVLTKPVTERDLRDAVSYAIARRNEAKANPPHRLRLWSGGDEPLAT